MAYSKGPQGKPVMGHHFKTEHKKSATMQANNVDAIAPHVEPQERAPIAKPPSKSPQVNPSAKDR